jgi:methyl coenzyme M reductase subunit C-like uncharacterized protein (methanogenesis marker protein 7)
MQEEFFNFVNRFNQNVFDATKQLAEINAHVCEKLVQNQIKVAGLYMEGGARQTELVRDFKDVAGYMASQGELAKEYADLALTVTKDNLDVMAKARNELKEWFEKGVAQAASVTPVAGVMKAA